MSESGRYVKWPAPCATITGGPLAFPTANIPDLFEGNTYFDIHDINFPSGEIRGVLVPIPEPGTLISTGFGAAIMLVRTRKRRPSGAPSTARLSRLSRAKSHAIV